MNQTFTRKHLTVHAIPYRGRQSNYERKSKVCLRRYPSIPSASETPRLVQLTSFEKINTIWMSNQRKIASNCYIFSGFKRQVIACVMCVALQLSNLPEKLSLSMPHSVLFLRTSGADISNTSATSSLPASWLLSMCNFPQTVFIACVKSSNSVAIFQHSRVK